MLTCFVDDRNPCIRICARFEQNYYIIDAQQATTAELTHHSIWVWWDFRLWESDKSFNTGSIVPVETQGRLRYRGKDIDRRPRYTIVAMQLYNSAILPMKCQTWHISASVATAHQSKCILSYSGTWALSNLSKHYVSQRKIVQRIRRTLQSQGQVWNSSRHWACQRRNGH